MATVDTKFTLSGTQEEIDEFVTILKSELSIPAFDVSEAKPHHTNIFDNQPLGQVELLEVVIHFGTAIAAHMIADVIKVKYEEWRKQHPATKLKDTSNQTSVTEPQHTVRDVNQ